MGYKSLLIYLLTYLIELCSLGVTAVSLRAKIDRKSAKKAAIFISQPENH